MRKSSVTTFVICGLILCLGVWGCESKPTYTVAVAVLPADAGTVSGGGSFASGYTATLTAAPAAGYEFSGWSGDASGTDNPLELAVNSDLAITAEFVRLFSVEAEVLPAGAGSVTGCAVVRTGRPVTLTALPADGYYFSGWSGSVAGTADPLIITVNADLDITAEFREGGRWTWMGGVSSVNQEPVFGTLGVPNPANHPGSRWGAATWTDTAGDFWLFGGARNAVNTSEICCYHSDLWRFDGACWTWMGGPQAANHPGVYGTLGVANPANFPGGRFYSGVWSDGQGNEYLFGGFGYIDHPSWYPDDVYYNDLWKFDGSSWTWMSGPQVAGWGSNNALHQSYLANLVAVYGTLGVPNPANYPGGRSAFASWVDPSGLFWLYGGCGYAASYKGYPFYGLSDLWTCDGTTWTWMSGEKTNGASPVYGTRGVADTGNTPGSRSCASALADSAGNAWLFGGEVFTPSLSSSGYYSDLWRFDGSCWTWVAGPDTRHQPGRYGIRGVPDAANCPGGRASSATWMDSTGNLWIYGGWIYGGTYIDQNVLSDLWRFDGACWTWMDGSDAANMPAYWGTMWVSRPSNHPGGRMCASAWIDPLGDLWMLGGGQRRWVDFDGPKDNVFSDLWRFTP